MKKGSSETEASTAESNQSGDDTDDEEPVCEEIKFNPITCAEKDGFLKMSG